MARHENSEFELRGINHLALVSKDMARTVDFYSNVLGMYLQSMGHRFPCWPYHPTNRHTMKRNGVWTR